MNFNPPVVSRSESIAAIIELVIRHNIGAVIIAENDVPLGIITEKDIIERVINVGKNVENTTAKDIMTVPILTIESSQSIKEALDLLQRNNLRRLPVTRQGKLIGLTTERRLLESAHNNYLMQSRLKEKEAIHVSVERPNVAFLSTYPPRECGIATYTNDLVTSISALQAISPPVITAINDRGGYYDYPNSVKIQIDREEIETYREAAKIINTSGIDVVNLQHEFGLFGGVWGDYLIEFLNAVEKPVVTTLHTILQNPPPDAERVTKEILDLSDCVVTMARVGIRILEQQYETLAFKSRYIPHGGPNVPFIQSETQKQFVGLEGRVIVSTFGLISRGKGIEYAINAIPEIVEIEPRVLYLIIGETHPEVRKHEGESYRQELYDLVESLGITGNVRFVNRFLDKPDLIRFLQATDVYVIPYPNREQISSGTLLYALSTGKAIVSTPFLHAEEVMSQGACVGCEFRDPHSIAENVKNFLLYEKTRENYERRAYEYSRDMIWPNVGMKYVNLFYETLGL
jgi:glycosyltransferase involved in cell wall biosynthesis